MSDNTINLTLPNGCEVYVNGVRYVADGDWAWLRKTISSEAARYDGYFLDPHTGARVAEMHHVIELMDAKASGLLCVTCERGPLPCGKLYRPTKENRCEDFEPKAKPIIVDAPVKMAGDVTPEDGIKNEPKDIKGYAICPEWSGGIPWCTDKACPAFREEDVPICALTGCLPPKHYATVCVPEVRARRGWFHHMNCKTALPPFNGDDEPDDASFDWESLERWVKTHDGRLYPVGLLILSKAVLGLRGKAHNYDLGMVHRDVMNLERNTESLDERVGELQKACRNDAENSLRARNGIRDRLSALERKLAREVE